MNGRDDIKVVMEGAIRVSLGSSAGGPVVVGVSGGPDSVALLHAVRTWAARCTEKGKEAAVIAAHLEHGLRGEAGVADAVWVRELAKQMGLPFVREDVDVGRMAREENISLEEAAREARYSFLERVAADAGGRLVAVGHTRDDQVETVLLRILRGTGLKGLGGMEARRPIRFGSAVELVRPFLDISRQQVSAYLDELKASCRTDASNLDRVYTRNRVRHDLLPQLRRDFNGSVDEALLRLAGTSREAYDLVARLAHAVYGDMVSTEGEGRVVLHLLVLWSTEPVVAAELLAHMIGRPLGRPAGLSYMEVRRILDLAHRSGSGGEVPLAGGFLARREYDRIVIEQGSAPTRSENGEKGGTPIAVDGETVVGDFKVATRTVPAERFDLAAFVASKEPLEEAFDADRVGTPVARGRLVGDRYRPLGMTGTKKIKDILIDRKWPRPDRDRLVVIESGSRIVWPVGCPIGEDFKVTGETRNVLIVKVRG